LLRKKVAQSAVMADGTEHDKRRDDDGRFVVDLARKRLREDSGIDNCDGRAGPRDAVPIAISVFMFAWRYCSARQAPVKKCDPESTSPASAARPTDQSDRGCTLAPGSQSPDPEESHG